MNETTQWVAIEIMQLIAIVALVVFNILQLKINRDLLAMIKINGERIHQVADRTTT